MSKFNLSCFLLLTVLQIVAQVPTSSFIHYTTDQGLSSDHITAIEKDKFGFLWIGTVNGLNRFDGQTFRVFQPNKKDHTTIPGDQITGITPAPDGWLWISTTSGLCKLDPVLLQAVQIPLPENKDTIINDMVTRVAFDSQGKAWTTTQKGILKIDPATGNIELFFPTTLSSLGWYAILIDDLDRVWMVKDGVYRFDPRNQELKTFRGSTPDTTLSLAGVLSLVEDGAETIWAGTWNYGIWKYRPDIDEFENYSLAPSLAMMLLPDSSKAGKPVFWVGGGQTGLAYFDCETKEFSSFYPDPKDPFTHNHYLATVMYKEPSNDDVWLGTEVGLEHYAPTTIRFGRAMIPMETEQGQFSLVCGAVHDRTDPNKDRYYFTLWGNGLFQWQKSNGTFTRLKSPSNFMTGPNNFNLLQDRNGYLWSCMKGGIGRYYPPKGSWRDYVNPFKHKERNNLFWCGLEDRQGNLWFGANKEGLFKYDPASDEIVNVFFDDGLTDASGSLNIVEISEDKKGRLWLAAVSSLLIRWDPKTGEAKKFSYEDKGIGSVCNSVEVGDNGRIYAGFYNTMIEVDEDGNLLRVFNQENGLKTNRLIFMIKDQQGKIWSTSEYLLHCFDPATSTFTYYGKPDGLFSNAMTDALSITPDGEIFIGFQNAFNYFHPKQLRQNLEPPPMAITSIKVMNKERHVSIRKHSPSIFQGEWPWENGNREYDTLLILKPGEDFFEVEFAALNFNQQERNQYAYKLEGFHQDWIYTDRPLFTFTNPDGGQYTLRMKASNNDGVWNEKGIQLNIQVNPPFYKTYWFFLLASCLLAGIFAGWIWLRHQQRERLQKFRDRLARDLHDEMGSTLSSIRFFSEYADREIGKDKPQVRPVLQRISQSASNLSESMQDIIWAMKTKNDHLDDIAAHMVEFGSRLLESRNVNFKTEIDEDFSGKQIQPEVRRNIYLIFKEAINNTAKYSEATEVTLHLGLKKGMIEMNIRDNGKGFDMNDLPSGNGGNGLQNMRNRAREIGGHLAIESKPGEGTVVDLHVKA